MVVRELLLPAAEGGDWMTPSRIAILYVVGVLCILMAFKIRT